MMRFDFRMNQTVPPRDVVLRIVSVKHSVVQAGNLRIEEQVENKLN